MVKSKTKKHDALTGVVSKVLPNARFEVRLPNGHIIKEAYLSGQMNRYSIHITLGDTVKVEVSPYDLSKGRIVFRGKESNPVK